MNRIVLDKIKVQARAELPPQVFHDLEVSNRYDYVSKNTILNLKTYLYQHKELKEEEVDLDVEIPDEKYMSLYMSNAAITFLTFIGVIFEVHVGFFLLIPVLTTLSMIFFLPIKTKVKKKINFEKIAKFPNNSIIYPEGMGRPIISYYFKEDKNA